MKLKKITDPQKELKIGRQYLYKAYDNWQVGSCRTPYPGSPDKKALCNSTYASITATDDCITDIYEIPKG